MERKYPALRAISAVFKVLSVLAFLGGIAVGIGVATKGMAEKAVLSIGLGVLYAVSLWAGAEMILVILDIEENTRRTAELLSKRPGEGE